MTDTQPALVVRHIVRASPDRVFDTWTPDGTEIVVTHTGIATEPMRQGHRDGWFGCLDGLTELLEQATA